MSSDPKGNGASRDSGRMSVSSLLADWGARLAEAGVPSPRHDARALAAHVLEVTPGELFLLADFESDDVTRIEALVSRRATREPLQYITGSVGFLGLDLLVGPGVFVPRPETELMADHVVKYLLEGRSDSPPSTREDRPPPGRSEHILTGPYNKFPRPCPDQQMERASAGGPMQPAIPCDGQILVVDLCTGSGALGLAVAANVDDVASVGVEASPIASEYARRNSERCLDRLAARYSSFEVVEADAIAVANAELVQLQGTVDVVVCNPPYVPDDAIPRDVEVREFDPAEALYGGPDGLDIIRRLVDTAVVLLRPGGLLAMEHADSQGEDAGTSGVPGFLRDHLRREEDDGRPESTFQRVVDHLDLTDRPRFTTAIRNA